MSFGPISRSAIDAIRRVQKLLSLLLPLPLAGHHEAYHPDSSYCAVLARLKYFALPWLIRTRPVHLQSRVTPPKETLLVSSRITATARLSQSLVRLFRLATLKLYLGVALKCCHQPVC